MNPSLHWLLVIAEHQPRSPLPTEVPAEVERRFCEHSQGCLKTSHPWIVSQLPRAFPAHGRGLVTGPFQHTLPLGGPSRITMPLNVRCKSFHREQHTLICSFELVGVT